MRAWLRAIHDKWAEDDVPRLSAATSFYALMSLAPLLVLGVAIAGKVFGSETYAKRRMLHEVEISAGKQVSDFLSGVIENSQHGGAGVTAVLIGLAISTWSASNLFIQIHDSVHYIWDHKITESLFKRIVRERLTAFGAVLGFGALLVLWIALESWITATGHETFGRTALGYDLVKVVSFVFGVGFFTCSLAGIYHTIPRNRTELREVWPGAFIAALSLTLSKYVLNTYFSVIKVSAAYGSAGAIVVLLFWIYYAAIIFYFGAQIVFITAQKRIHREQFADAPINLPTDDSSEP